MLPALEYITRHLSMMNILDVVLGSVKPEATILQVRKLCMHVLTKEDTVGSTAPTCARSDMPTTTANVLTTSIHLRLGRGKLAGLVGNRPPIASSRSLFLSSLLQAKSNLHLLRDRIQGLQSQLTRAKTMVVTHLHLPILHLQVNLRLRLDHWPHPSSRLRRSRINPDTRLLQMAATSQHLTP